ncbi:MAG: SUMF1/EgtB/PvdO family nonheme iron enzyme [Victivallales bacterium]
MGDCTGDSIREIAFSLDSMMVKVPGGAFNYGLFPEELEKISADEGVHPDFLHFHSRGSRMILPAFWIDTYPVTRIQFFRFMRETGHKIERNGWLAGWSDYVDVEHLDDPGRYFHPMVGVNSQDAKAYAEWAGKRLPKETEWEKAARGTEGCLFPWGEEFHQMMPGDNEVFPLDTSFPVGVRPENASPYGANDMKGGVLEWTRRVFPPVSPDGTTYDDFDFVLAGSSTLHRRPSSHMVTSRWSWHPAMRIYNTGFRCASYSPTKKSGKFKYTPDPALSFPLLENLPETEKSS